MAFQSYRVTPPARPSLKARIAAYVIVLPVIVLASPLLVIFAVFDGVQWAIRTINRNDDWKRYIN